MKVKIVVICMAVLLSVAVAAQIIKPGEELKKAAVSSVNREKCIKNAPSLQSVWSESITVDGKLEDWDGIPFTDVNPSNGVFDEESAKTDQAADISYRFAVCNDATAMYVAVMVTDDRLVVDSGTCNELAARAWEDDAVELFIDGNHNHASNARDKERKEMMSGGEFSLVINRSATSECTGWPKSFNKPEYWSGSTNVSWTSDNKMILLYEYRIPFAMMGKNTGPGKEIGFTIGVQDDDDGGGRDHALYWSGISPHCWKDEAGWGNIKLAVK